jgi:spermidine synthase/S-adenosylmethionine/arginine decarboxylase-like enzyme
MRIVSPAVAALLGCFPASLAAAAVSSIEIEPTCEEARDGSCASSLSQNDLIDNADSSSSSSSNNNSRKSLSLSPLHQNVIDWIVQAGGYFNDKQEIRPIQNDKGFDTFGVFATADIEEGEVLARIPGSCIVSGWHKKYDEEPWGDGGAYYCGTTLKLMHQVALGKGSYFSPYLELLMQQNPAELPFNWTEGGRSLLKEVLGYYTQYKEHAIPPTKPLDNQKDYQKRCKRKKQISAANDKGDNVETLLAMQVMQRSYFDHMVPVFDFYNHGNGPSENLDFVFSMNKKRDELHEVKIIAWRAIQKGQELRKSHNQAENIGMHANDYYGTADFLRDYGFVEDYPRRWTFVNRDFNVGFELSHKNASFIGADDTNTRINDLNLEFLDWSDMDFSYEITANFRRHLHRIEESVEPLMQRTAQKMLDVESSTDEGSLPTEREFSIVRKYLDGVKVAFRFFLGVANEYRLNGPGVKPYREIRRVEGSRDPFDHESFPTYNEQFYAKGGIDDGWEIVNKEESGYQTITFLSHNGTDNFCFVLDGEPQTCSYFSAHYHDIACHFPTRYLESVKRVAIIGGGDSKMLQDILQYNETLEKVIHLELDQKGTRQCFKYFATEPHFDDDRIEWYFGDAAKSLLMIPSEYFGTFDLVFVDLSESGPLSLAVTADLTVWESVAQLVAPDGILVKNEIYKEALNLMFDHTLMLYYEQVPLIESWALTFATNRKDLLTPNPETMAKWKNVKTILPTFQPTATDVNDHFLLAHDYRQNDAMAAGQCESGPVANGDNTTLAGLLMIIDAEQVSADPLLLQDWSKLGSLLTDIMVDELGFTKLSSISHKRADDEILGIIVFEEGAVTARTWPEERYCALDIQLWGSFGKMKDIKSMIVTRLKSETASSFRMITSGIRGTSTESEDRKLVGPPGINHRDCTGKKRSDGNIETAEIPSLTPNVFDGIIKESLNMIQDPNGTIVVLCGTSDEPCRSIEAISLSVDDRKAASDSDWNVMAFWTCPAIEMVNNATLMTQEQTKQMLECNAKLLKELQDAVKEHGRVVGFVVDQKAPVSMAMVADRLWRDDVNQHLLAKRFTFLAPIENPSVESWRRDFIDLRRRDMVDYGHLFRAEVVVQQSDNTILELGVLSGQDREFFSRLVNVTNEIQTTVGVSAIIREIEGGVEEIDLNQQHTEWPTEERFDRPGESHFRTQVPLGEQHMLQFSVRSIPQVDVKIPTLLEQIFWKAFYTQRGERFDVRIKKETVGRGLVYAVAAPQGTALVVWDGDNRIDVNVFAYGREFLDSAIIPFAKHPHLETESFDEFPRGIGKVINLLRDIKPKTTADKL